MGIPFHVVSFEERRYELNTLQHLIRCAREQNTKSNGGNGIRNRLSRSISLGCGDINKNNRKVSSINGWKSYCVQYTRRVFAFPPVLYAPFKVDLRERKTTIRFFTYPHTHTHTHIQHGTNHAVCSMFFYSFKITI